ncbi:MAG: VWA domain-containing protein [Acidimicrobiaceae bacterium]|nr:VWA domain-containing protein [Acidimicrobiaceae bacterium]MCY4279231.1 VWA domain-containing protein [Acidimicrobiaceae bacterium]
MKAAATGQPGLPSLPDEAGLPDPPEGIGMSDQQDNAVEPDPPELSDEPGLPFEVESDLPDEAGQPSLPDLPVEAGDPLLDLINGFIAELRAVGIPASLTESLDAMEAVKHINIAQRDTFKYALAATLVKNQAHWQAFETVFEVYFSLRGDEYAISGDADAAAGADPEDDGAEPPPEGQGGAAGASLSPEELAEMLYRALLQGDGAMLRAVAREAVRRYAGMEPGRPVGGTYYLYRTLRNLDLDGVLERLMQAEQDSSGDPEADSDAADDFKLRLRRDEHELRIAELKRQIESEIRRRLVADRGVEAMAKTLRRPLPADIDFMHASREEMASLRKAIYPLTRKLAARLVRKRRHGRNGPLDFRSTVRHSLSYGGVPAEPKFRHKRPHKPDIMVIADVSGSVAAFARFTLHLVYAISSQFSKVRSFVFIDGLDEVTGFFEGGDDISEAIHKVNTEAEVVWVDGHSDYGHALGVFWDNYVDGVGPRTTVLILGDARNNYHAPESWIVKAVQSKARQVFWLNPEPRSYWDTGDSIVGEYAPYCDGVFEVRNLRQLEAFVDRLA